MEALSVATVPLRWHTSSESNGHGEVVVVAVSGELDRGTAPHLQHELERFIGARPCSIILDARDVTFADLGGYRMLDDIARALAAVGQPLVVRSPGPAVRRLLQLVGVPAGLLVEDSETPSRGTW